ncbi:MAG: hypothetical protein ABID61_05470 [Candidatus Micrarchaeota archaeon]
MDLKRTIKCSNCGNESSIQMTSDLEMKEVLIAGKCTRCGSAMQINYTLVDSSSSNTQQNPLSYLSTQQEESTVPDLEEALFTPHENDSDMLKDLMED